MVKRFCFDTAKMWLHPMPGRTVKLRKSILVGHSMGGYVALAFTASFSNKVKGLCLLNSTAFADSLEKQQNRDRAISVVKKNHISFIRTAVPLLTGIIF